jgi:hypothetical protein
MTATFCPLPSAFYYNHSLFKGKTNTLLNFSPVKGISESSELIVSRSREELEKINL